MRPARWAMAVAVCIVVASCGGPSPTGVVPSPTSTVEFGEERVTVRFAPGAQVRAEVASTIAQLGRGLMYRTELAPDDGMLFLLPVTRSDGFYMKNTLLPLSIAYLRRTDERSFRVVAILDMEPCPPETVDCPTYPPGTSYDAALEVNQGWFERSDVGVGATATVSGSLPASAGGASPAA